jgi:hypothetical protein
MARIASDAALISSSLAGPFAVAADTRFPPPAPSRKVNGPDCHARAGGHVASSAS